MFPLCVVGGSWRAATGRSHKRSKQPPRGQRARHKAGTVSCRYGFPPLQLTLPPRQRGGVALIVGGIGDPPVLAPAVDVHGLVKRYGALTAVDGISFDVRPGEIFGFLGPNGAGKSTTIKMLCTLANPSAGSARVAGHDVETERLDVRRNIGLVFQDTTLDQYLTAEQNLRFHAELYGMDRATVPERMRQVLEMVGLWERRAGKVRTFSGGMQRRLEIARGLMHSPRVLFLDEPTVGLDPQTRSSIWSYIDELREREEITIFLTTHYMDEAENCDRIAIIDAGRLVVLDTPDALKASIGTDRVQIATEDDAAAITALRQRLGLDAEMHEGLVTIAVPDGHHFVPRLFAELGVPIRSVQVARPSLDDVFMSYTGRTIRDAEATAVDGMRTFITASRR
ncbi:MAG: ATP-binding cassette domain-containing protein [Acidimicrobiia bacterium]|nr:ATP-binding cassette domain-containing protein [Acidimicrobiia bacterium]